MMHETQPLVGWNPHLLQRDTYQQERRGHKKLLSPLLFSGSAGRWGATCGTVPPMFASSPRARVVVGTRTYLLA